MRALVIYTHPIEGSFCSALRDTVCAALNKGGHDVRVIDLYAEGFDPVLSADERSVYNDLSRIEEEMTPKIGDHIAALRWAEALIFVYPTWWFGLPAMLKGWLDRVWLPGLTFKMPTKSLPLRPALLNVRHIVAVSTLGSPRWFWSAIIGAPGRKELLRGLRVCAHPRCRTKWMALHRMNTCSDADRSAFLASVADKIARLR